MPWCGISGAHSTEFRLSYVSGIMTVTWCKISLDNNGDLDLKESLSKAKELGFSRIFLEAGARLTTSFFNKKLIDDFKLFISSKRLGKNGSRSVKKYLKSFLKNKKKIVEKVNLSGDKLISYKIK